MTTAILFFAGLITGATGMLMVIALCKASSKGDGHDDEA